MAGLTGHRNVRNEQRAQVIINALRAGNTREAAAVYSGISHDTFARWKRDDAKFRRACDEAEASCEVRMATIVADAAFGRPAQYDDAGRVIRAEVKADADKALQWLERRRPHAWGRRITMDVRATIERYAAAQGLDPEELIAEAERLVAEHAQQYR